MQLTLSSDGSGIMKCWVDASFAVPLYMLGHSGGGLSYGFGFKNVNSNKKELNTSSSTEAKIVEVDVLFPNFSSDKRTKHINIRYSFITDRVAKGKVYFFITDRVEGGWVPNSR